MQPRPSCPGRASSAFLRGWPRTCLLTFISLAALLPAAVRAQDGGDFSDPGFANAGGMIGFVQRGENLRFQVNLASARRTGLKLSARLSGLAEILNPAQP